MRTIVSIDGIKLTPFCTEEVLADIIEFLGRKSKSFQITYVNAYVYCLAKSNVELRAFISDSEIVLADGISIVWAALLIERIRIHRCIMTKVLDAFLVSSGIPVCKCILIGATEPEAKKAQEKINSISRNVQIVEAYSGYHTLETYSEILKEHNSIDIVLIGMSSPKSEYLCKLARVLCKDSIIWHIGGGTIKCYAETKRRASEWTSKLGLESIHRFLFEKHTRKRFLTYGFVFIYHVLIGFFKSICRLFVPSKQRRF
jgi:N-acetylglucosaminyldiphosphoundecaprenol N-acetyl-beta-D-mannosaminyltransferase